MPLIQPILLLALYALGEQQLIDLDPGALVLRKEAAIFLAQILEDRPGFEDLDGPAARSLGVDDGRDAVVERDL